jgi:hypothetical protein
LNTKYKNIGIIIIYNIKILLLLNIKINIKEMKIFLFNLGYMNKYCLYFEKKIIFISEAAINVYKNNW